MLTIIRGLPGAGKSHVAHKLAQYTGALLIEPDSLLIENSEYKYTQDKYEEAFERSLAVIELVTKLDYCNDDGSNILLPDIIFADVLPRAYDVKRVINSVEFPLRPQDVTILEIPCTPEESVLRSQHNVRKEDLDRMVALWEPWDWAKYSYKCSVPGDPNKTIMNWSAEFTRLKGVKYEAEDDDEGCPEEADKNKEGD